MESYNQVYEKIYKKCANEIETAKKRATIIALIFPILMLSIIIINFIVSKAEYTFIYIVILLAFCLPYFIWVKKHSKYNKIFKETVIKTLFEAYDENFKYYPNAGMPSRIYDNAGFESYDFYYSEDNSQGELKNGYKINMAEVKTEREEYDNEGRKTKVLVFRGIFAEVSVDKPAIMNMKIVRNRARVPKNSIKRVHTEIIDKLEMDSSEFEKIYDVYTSDKVMAMRILTHDVMDLFVDFKNRYKLIPEVVLKNGKVYVRFATGDSYEANLNVFKSALDYEVIKKYYDMIDFTLNIAEQLSNNIGEFEP